MLVPRHTIRVPQTAETAAVFECLGRFTLRYAYLRAPDAQASDEPGQDFLQVVHDGQRLAFALCDGVSQSFFGELAACILGEALTDWFWEPDDIERWLAARLHELSASASKRISAIDLPRDLSPLVSGVLEGKRVLGSESMFTAGGVHLVSSTITLSWMGDSRLRVWDNRQRERTHRLLGRAPLDTTQRWSSARGPVGEPRVVTVDSSNIRRIVAYSDGLAKLDSTPIVFESSDQLQRAVASGASASGDGGVYCDSGPRQ
jgi:hypothetical protein